MNRRRFDLTLAPAVLVLALGFLGCNSATDPGSSDDSKTSSTPSLRSYNGTASVGDFLTITIDATAQTISYANQTNGDSGVVPYTVNEDGTYAITDPAHNLLTAYEVPGFAMVVASARCGANHATPALITAIESKAVTISDFAGRRFNYVQLRTQGGGTEIGHVAFDAQGSITHGAYFPAGDLNEQPHPFGGGVFAASSVTEDASGRFFVIHEADASKDYVFGTQNGLFAVDTDNGTILGLPQSSSKAFAPSTAGVYKAILYRKSGAQNGPGGVESGAVSLGTSTVTIGSGGAVSVVDGMGNVLAAGTLTAVADAPYLYDGSINKLTDPCNGLFTLRVASASSRQDLFLSFQGNAVVFSGFQTALPLASGNLYLYYNGVGLK